LRSFSEEMIAKPMILVASEIDVAQDQERVNAVERLAREHGMPFLRVSGVTGEGVQELVREMASVVYATAPEAA
jgi:GTPase